MSFFKSIEHKLEGLVEGGFGRAFKSSVQPVELANKLAKEMGDHKTVGVATVYVPNEFEIYLGADDYKHLKSFADSLKVELSNYVTAYAGREGWTLVAPPRIELCEDGDLRVGEFGIATRTVNAPPAEPAPAAAAAPAPGPRRAPGAAPVPCSIRPCSTTSRCDRVRRRVFQNPPCCAVRLATIGSVRPSPSSAAAVAATSSSRTPTCRASTPRSGAGATAMSSATSVPPTARG